MCKKILVAAILLFMITAGHAQHRVIIHVASNDTSSWKGLMNNIKNLKSSWGDSIMIEVVAHGPGLDLFTKDKTNQLDKITYYKKMGVDFRACESAMAERKIPKDAILADVGFIPMAVKEIILRQEQGWSYIKAGF
jgi:intracellular sulfur oxidation DsrE/DsrF family protein